MNFKTILTNFSFAIFTQHHTISDTIIVKSKCQFVKRSIIHRNTLQQSYFIYNAEE